ncbi:hypothetical protein [Pelagicoccus albus]|uniref:Uncharacterized protein n=1 Tax=Pelagicoccus albus TaxID=415222 RepID=A0A7X1E9H7_9BACT|nr:hypothetical protein [Pelagicoccus albus]MBC2607429.1 hypothetical protein [Pelagicoccus albus]
MNKRVSSLWTYPLKYGYVLCIGVLAVMAFNEEAKETRLLILSFGSLIVLINFMFYHNLATVYQFEDGLRFKKSKKEFEYTYPEIQEVEIERFVNCQPIRIRTSDGKKFRFLSVGSLYWANMELVNELKNRSNQSSHTTPASAPR